MADRPDILYLPFDWADEYQPYPQPSPDDYIQVDQTGWFWLHPRDHEGDLLTPDDPFYDLREELSFGSITQFCRFRLYGNMTVTKNGDGTFTYDPPPEGPTWFYAVGDNDVSGHTIEEMLEEVYFESGPFEVGMVEEMTSQSFKFAMFNDKPKFVSAKEAN